MIEEYLEYSLLINSKSVDLKKIDERLNYVEVTSEKNIRFVFDVIKRYLRQYNG